MTIRPPDRCVSCQRFQGTAGEYPELILICEAFPAGIPREIITEEFDHITPFEGDGGKFYIPRKPEE